jgi:hypothetical protein
MAFLGVLESRKEKPLSERLASSLTAMGPQLAETLGQYQAGKQEDKALQRLTGRDFSGLSPDMKREFVKLYTGAHSQRAQEKQQMLETGLGTIQEMRGLLDASGGWFSNPLNKLRGFVPGEIQEKRTQLAQLGKSLIPLVSAGVSIRNQKEFDEYKKVITDPSASPSEMEGALSGLESLMSRQIQSSPGMEIQEKEDRPRPIFDISDPSHKKTFDALMKKYKNDRNKVRKELSKYFEE